MTILLQGLVAGAAHVLTGPDHLAGVAPLAVDRPRRVHASLVGASWGLGHGVGVAVLGVLAQTVLSITSVEVASGYAERLVGVVLVVIGGVAIHRARGLFVHEHVHSHDGDVAPHAHLHVHHEHTHGESKTDAHDGAAPAHAHRHAAFGVGILHGLAGAGHFWAVLPSMAMSPPDAALFIGSYLVASVAIMTLFGVLLEHMVRVLGERSVPRLMLVAGATSIVVGTYWLIGTPVSG